MGLFVCLCVCVCAVVLSEIDESGYAGRWTIDSPAPCLDWADIDEDATFMHCILLLLVFFVGVSRF